MKHFTQTALTSIDSYKTAHPDQYPEGTGILHVTLDDTLQQMHQLGIT